MTVEGCVVLQVFFWNFLKALTWSDCSLQNKEEEIGDKRDENSDYSDFKAITKILSFENSTMLERGVTHFSM